MKKLMIAAALCTFGGMAQAQSSLPQEHINAMACLENMGTSTSWNQCLGLIFAPCVTDEVGSEAHVACLQVQRENWSASMQFLQKDVTDAITLKSAEDLFEILSGWINYVSQKCQAGEDATDNSATGGQAIGLPNH